MTQIAFWRQVLFTFILSLAAISARADLGEFTLCSPGNGDHFEVSRPLLFWQSSIGASHYEIFVDDKRVAKVKAAPVPVMSYAVQRSLTDGTHRWFVKATGSGTEIESTSFVFTVEPSTQWPAWAIGPFVKYGGNPVLRPADAAWESWNVYNPGVIFDDGRFRMLYRGQENIPDGIHNRTLSRIGYAESPDGVTFHCEPLPVIDAAEPFESRYGCEDARLVKYRGTYYAFYTGNLSENSGKICLCEATSGDCIHWKKLGIVETGTKNGAIVRDPAGTPVKINSKFVMYTGDSSLGVCYSDDLIHWGPITWVGPMFPKGWVAPYEPCVAVTDYSRRQPDNIVLFIAGTLNGKGKWFYAVSEMLFSKSNVTVKLAQLDDCVMKPTESYESGTFPNCIWMNSILLHNGQWWMHYGAGDRNIGLATAPASF
jgi:beta-1,2-mannosidase